MGFNGESGGGMGKWKRGDEFPLAKTHEQPRAGISPRARALPERPPLANVTTVTTGRPLLILNAQHKDGPRKPAGSKRQRGGSASHPDNKPISLASSRTSRSHFSPSFSRNIYLPVHAPIHSRRSRKKQYLLKCTRIRETVP